MIGRSTAALEIRPGCWFHRIWGRADIHARQKWKAVWPQLRELPSDGLRLLDAGCGAGTWALELAARRPGWSVVGIDQNGAAVEAAERTRRRLDLKNVRFIQSQFLDFRTDARFDVVLSVCSAHYLVDEGRGPELFETLTSWLAPQGRLVLLGPRQARETPFAPWLPKFYARELFTASQLQELCSSGNLSVQTLEGRIGAFGTLAKQVSWLGRGQTAWERVLYPLQWICTCFDSLLDSHEFYRRERKTAMWLLVALREPLERS